MTRPCYVFDLDGTLANIEHRLHYIMGEPKDCNALSQPDWRAFFAACGADSVIEQVVRLADDLADGGVGKYDIVIVSGRSDEVREITETWLFDHNISYGALYMRKAGDHRPDHVLKRELLEIMLADGWEPILFVDDRKQVVDMWRSLGYTVLQCAEGDF